jgi:hypothetical protein
MRFATPTTIAIAVATLCGCDRIEGLPAHDIRVAKQKLLTTFYDGDSARFRDVKRHTAEMPKTSPVAICGEVNGKNRYGAYVGFQRFVVELPAREVKLDPQIKTTENDIDQAEQGCHEIAKVEIDEIRAGLMTNKDALAGYRQCEADAQKLRDGYHDQTFFDAAWTVDCELPEAKGH